MDSDDLRGFVAFATTRSFTHGAAQVHLSQPALFAVVRRLSEALDAALYTREGRALAMTPAGEALLAHARSVLDAEQALRAELHGERAGPAVLACGEGALVHVVAARVAAFARAEPGRLQVRLADAAVALTLVASSEAHAAVVGDAGGLTLPTTLASRILEQSEVRAMGHAEHFSGPAEAPLGARALAALPLILPAAGRPLRVAVEALLAGRGLGPARVAAEASGWEAMLALARLNVGVALVNDIVPCPPTLVSRPVRGLPAVTYRCVTRRRPGALAEALMAALLRVPDQGEVAREA